MLRKLLLGGSAVVMLAAGAVAHADTFTYTDSIGAKYALDYTSLGGGNYDIFLTIDASSVTGGAVTLGDVAILATSGAYSNLSFISAPSGYPSSGLMDGGLSNGGCDGKGTGFFCFVGSAPVGKSGDVYTFEVSLSGTLADPGHVKDQFFNSDGVKVEQLSQDISLDPHTPTVPEPSSLALLGTGVLGAAGVLRRRFIA